MKLAHFCAMDTLIDQDGGFSVCQSNLWASTEKTACELQNLVDDCELDSGYSMYIVLSSFQFRQGVHYSTGIKISPLLSPCLWEKAYDTDSYPSFRPGNLHNDPLFKCQSTCTWCMFSGYTNSTDLTRCNRRQIGDPCTTDEDCSAVIDNGQCVHGLCVCKSGTIVNTLLTTCYVRKEKIYLNSLYDSCIDTTGLTLHFAAPL